MIFDQSNANPWQICQSITNLSILRQFYTNLPIHHQFANSSPICQSITNLMPICQSNANLVILDQSNANPYQICQSITNSSIQPQFYTNLPIHNQFTNSSPIWPLHAPISANRKNRTVTDRQDIGTHWHRSRQSRERTGNRFTTVHRQLTIEDRSIRTQVATQSPLNQEPIGNQSVRTLYRDLMELVL